MKRITHWFTWRRRHNRRMARAGFWIGLTPAPGETPASFRLRIAELIRAT
jgi:hypothetical protein